MYTALDPPDASCVLHSNTSNTTFTSEALQLDIVHSILKSSIQIESPVMSHMLNQALDNLGFDCCSRTQGIQSVLLDKAQRSQAGSPSKRGRCILTAAKSPGHEKEELLARGENILFRSQVNLQSIWTSKSTGTRRKTQVECEVAGYRSTYMKKLPARIVQHQQRQLHLPLTTLRNSHPSPANSHRALIHPRHCPACIRECSGSPGP